MPARKANAKAAKRASEIAKQKRLSQQAADAQEVADRAA
jgi:hypothetical protein